MFGCLVVEINFGDVVCVIELDFCMVECFYGDDNYCVIICVCGLCGVLYVVLWVYFEVFDGYMLQDLVDKLNVVNWVLGEVRVLLMLCFWVKFVLCVQFVCCFCCVFFFFIVVGLCRYVCCCIMVVGCVILGDGLVN